MPPIAIFDSETSEWLNGRDSVPPEVWEKFAEAELDGQSRVHHPGDDNHLQMFEARMDANREVRAHAHGADEIVYVIGGEMILGRQVLRPGSSVYIPAMTLYSFKTGPEGLQFLNFRARRDMTMYSKEEFLAMRGDAADATELASA
jgi:mannose-6-phosphate isomerase-like protein (cupin superfamily)